MGVVYLTRSITSDENYVIVKRLLDHYDVTHATTSNHFRLSPPLLPLADFDLDPESLAEIEDDLDKETNSNNKSDLNNQAKIDENPNNSKKNVRKSDEKFKLKRGEEVGMETEQEDGGQTEIDDEVKGCMRVKHDVVVLPSRLSNGCYVAVLTREVVVLVVVVLVVVVVVVLVVVFVVQTITSKNENILQKNRILN